MAKPNKHRDQLVKNQNGECFYCSVTLNTQKRHRPDSATIDHVIPSSKGGTNARSNTVAACFSCNGKKADRTLQEFEQDMSKWEFWNSNNPLLGDWR